MIKKSSIQYFFNYIVTHRKWVLIISFLMMLLALFMAKDLRIIVETNEMLPASHPYVQGSKKITDTFGLKYSLVIGIQNPHGKINQDILDKTAKISEALKDTPSVVTENIISLSSPKTKTIQGTADGLEVQPLWSEQNSVTDIITAVEQTPLFQHVLLSDDQSTTFIIAEYQAHSKGYRDIMRAVNPILDQYRDKDTKIYTGGFVYLMAETEQYSDRVAMLLGVSFIIMAALFYAAFKTRQAMLIPLMTGLLTVILMLGVMGAVGIPLDVFNAVAPILILAVVAGHSVQVLKRYYEEYAEIPLNPPLQKGEVPLFEKEGLGEISQANQQAIIHSLSNIAPVTACAGLAAALGFFSLIVFQIQTVWVFGVMAGTALLIGLILEFTFIPALRATLKPPPQQQKNSWLLIRLQHISSKAATLATQQSKTVMAVCVIVVIFSILGVIQLRVENANKRNFAELTAVSRDDKILNQQLAGTNPLYVMVDAQHSDGIKNAKLLKALDALQTELEQQPDVGKVVSIADHIKRLYQGLNEGKTEFYTIPDDDNVIAELLFMYSLSGDPDDFSTFVDSHYQRASMAVFIKNDSSVRTGEIIKQIEKHLTEKLGQQVTLSFGGSLPEAYAINEVMVHDKLLNMLQVITVVWLVAALMFRSLFAGLMVIVPVLFAVLVNFGLMGWLGVPLNIPTSLCAAMVVGIGADYGIYLLYRWRAYVQQGLTVDDALFAMMPKVGTACLIVALSIAAGYSVLIFSYGFNPHQWMGMLIVTAMLVSVMVALTVMPILVRWVKPAFLYRGQT